MLVLKRNYQFWISIIAMHKLGAVVIPATDQLLEKDFVYRFNAAGVSAIVCTAESNAPAEAEQAMAQCPQVTVKVIASGTREGWHSFDSEYEMFRGTFTRTDIRRARRAHADVFHLGTTGYPKIAAHSIHLPPGHSSRPSTCNCVNPDGIHLPSRTPLGKSVWG
jgi:acetyl-CoA synthetase